MPLAGKQLLPREMAGALHVKWPGDELPKAVATGLGESQGYIGAWHDNMNESGDFISRDCGFMQINIPESQIETELEWGLRTISTDPAEIERVVNNGVIAARQLYDQPWTRGGKQDKRRWQPWVAYTSGWAMFPAWWVWHQENEKPVGPWMPTGRYIHRSIVGCANYHLYIASDKSQAEALAYAQKQAIRFKVDGTLHITAKGLVGWASIPPKPLDPPADGLGPRPVPNNGV